MTSRPFVPRMTLADPVIVARTPWQVATAASAGALGPSNVTEVATASVSATGTVRPMPPHSQRREPGRLVRDGAGMCAPRCGGRCQVRCLTGRFGSVSSARTRSRVRSPPRPRTSPRAVGRSAEAETGRAGRPGAPALVALDPLADPDLLGLGGPARDAGEVAAAVAAPGGGADLQAAVVAVAGVDVPAAAGLALGEPVPGPGRGGVRRGGHRDDRSGECGRGEGRRDERAHAHVDPPAPAELAVGFRRESAWPPVVVRRGSTPRAACRDSSSSGPPLLPIGFTAPPCGQDSAWPGANPGSPEAIRLYVKSDRASESSEAEVASLTPGRRQRSRQGADPARRRRTGCVTIAGGCVDATARGRQDGARA